MSGFWNPSRSTTSLLLAWGAALALACGDGSGGGGAGGGGGEGSPPSTVGSCSDPLDFNILSQEMGSVPFVKGSLENGHELLRSESCGGDGKELVYAWTPPRDGLLRMQRISLVEHLVIYARTSCDEPGSELGCVRTDPVQLSVQGGETLYFVVDSQRGTPDYDFSLSFQPTNLQVGERCGDGPPLGICASGLACVSLQGRCEIGIPPTIQEGLAHSFEERFLIRVWAHAPHGNIVAMRYRFKDEAGTLTTDEVFFDTKQYSYGQVEFMGGHILPLTAAAGAAFVEVRLEDDAGGSSNTIELPIEAAPVSGPGEACDPESFLGVCDEGLICNTRANPPFCEADPQEREDD